MLNYIILLFCLLDIESLPIHHKALSLKKKTYNLVREFCDSICIINKTLNTKCLALRNKENSIMPIRVNRKFQIHFIKFCVMIHLV